MRVTVKDTGCGIEAAVLPHIFEPFYTTKGSASGSGLGLSVVYGIVSQHQGWVQVQSTPGEGTVFSVFLPAAVAVKTSRTEKKPLPAASGRGETVLLVEDDADVRELAAWVLRDNGYLVREAACAEDALKLFERESAQFTLLLSDVVLPGLDGLELAERLLELKDDLAIVLMSGYTEDKSQLSLIRERGHGFIQKPFNVATLLGMISGRLGRSAPR